MTKKEFVSRIANDKGDFLQEFLDILEEARIQFCAIGGLAVNAYSEPVVSLDLDVVILSEKLDELLNMLKGRYSVTEYPNSINVAHPASDLRVQIQIDSRYQPFIEKSTRKKILDYDMPVASIEDVLQGKIWAAMDETGRASKRQKDMADIMRLLEYRGDLISFVPEPLKYKLFPGS